MISERVLQNPWFQLIALLSLITATILLVYSMIDVLIPFLIALILAYILNPAVDWLEEQLRISRMLAVILILILVSIVAIFVGYYLTEQTIRFGEQLRQIINEPPDFQILAEQYLPPYLNQVLQSFLERIQSQKFSENLYEYFWTNLTTFASSLTSGSNIIWMFASRTVGLIGIIINIMVVIFSTIYFLRDLDSMWNWIRTQIPPRHQSQIDQFVAEIDSLLKAFLRGHLIVCLIIGTLYGTGYLLIGLRGGFLIGFVSGLMNVIPYLGPSLGFLLALVMGLIQFGLSPWILAVVAVFVVVQSLEGNILTPNIVGNAVGLNPVAVILALMVFGKFMGFLGLLVAIPATAILKVIMVHVLETYRKSDFYRGNDVN